MWRESKLACMWLTNGYEWLCVGFRWVARGFSACDWHLILLELLASRGAGNFLPRESGSVDRWRGDTDVETPRGVFAPVDFAALARLAVIFSQSLP
jgi:hypothetical protein